MNDADDPAPCLTRNGRPAKHSVSECYLRPFGSSDSFQKLHIRPKQDCGTQHNLARFEQIVLPHMGAAYNLARWLTRNEHDAEDMVQEAYLRAFKFFDAFHGVDGRAWLLTIVRNTCYTWLQQNRAHEITILFDEEIHSADNDNSNPAMRALQSADQRVLQEALDGLPIEFREVVVLRDLEGFSYKEIAQIANIPTGTVMSRLARARERLKRMLCHQLKEDA